MLLLHITQLTMIDGALIITGEVIQPCYTLRKGDPDFSQQELDSHFDNCDRFENLHLGSAALTQQKAG